MNKISATSRSLAKEVLKGLWGNGEERYRRLTEAGYDANHIQDVVNSMYINGEVDKDGNYVGYEENLKEVEIDVRGYDGLIVTLVVD